MQTPTTLPEFLKHLRGCGSSSRHEKPIAALANEKGLNQTTLYKAEAGEPVRWDTIERGYGDLCKDDAEYARMLALWAVGQSKRTVTVKAATEALGKVCEQEHESLDRYIERMSAVLGNLTPSEREMLLRFCDLFASGQPTRSMAKAWLDAVAG